MPAIAKEAISLRVDADVLTWFREQGPRYQSRMHAVLRAYMQAKATPLGMRSVVFRRAKLCVRASASLCQPLPRSRMTHERRYNDQEVAQIIERASTSQEAERGGTLPTGDGLTLAALTEIAAEVGIGADHIARAAKEVSRGSLAPTQYTQCLGFPVGVARTVHFDRYLTDAEWEQLVVALRETFEAPGTLRHDGAFRQWTNGNLHALLEPTETGHRLRLTTRKDEGPVFLRLGAAALVLSTAMAAAMPVAPAGATIGLTAFSGVVGLAGMAVLALRLPRWARTRAAQMERIGAQFAALAAVEDHARMPNTDTDLLSHKTDRPLSSGRE